ncbi:hypothetical protein H6775_01365 [Candidatus Nomurabacteria bacterium]|nr:hypothetical protein [Candidatus Nomurabacteria bacterium]
MKSSEGIEDPKDILKLSSKDRKEALRKFKNEVVDRYFTIADLQEYFFDYVEAVYKRGEDIDFDMLKGEMWDMAVEEGLSVVDADRIELLIDIFEERYRNIQVAVGYDDQSLLNKCSNGHLNLDNLAGSFFIERTPYSLNFSFSSKEDFDRFVTEIDSNVEHKVISKKEGLSFLWAGIPITAEFNKKFPVRSDVFDHEQQHKKFFRATFDTIGQESDWERETKNEILAFWVTIDNLDIIRRTIIEKYTIPERRNVDANIFESVLDKALQTLKDLGSLNMKKQKIIHLLSRERITDWPKIYKRIAEGYE